jgi:hypothetical protein
MEALLVAWGIAGLFFVSILAVMIVKNIKETRRNYRAVDPLFRLDSPTYILENCRVSLLRTDEVLRKACATGEYRRPLD